MMQRVTGYVTAAANRERMDFGETTRTGEWFEQVYLPAAGRYFAAFEAWRDPATRVPARQERLVNEEKAFRPVVRRLYLYFLKYNYFVGDDDLANMGLPGRAGGRRSPAPVATEAPRATVMLERVGAVVIAHGGKRAGGARPAGQHGVECCHVISAVPVVDHEALACSTFGTRTPLVLEFAGHDRGKTVYFALRWENTRGQKGPFSAIGSAVIP
jgi:hypothetical protein